MNPQRDRTLWARYAMLGAAHRAWYSGDTGMHDALDSIGTKYGPFDVTLIEAGQYDAAWPDWHLGPAQAVDANRRVRGHAMIPVHWARFKLAHHGWTEPPNVCSLRRDVVCRYASSFRNPVGQSSRRPVQ